MEDKDFVKEDKEITGDIDSVLTARRKEAAPGQMPRTQAPMPGHAPLHNRPASPGMNNAVPPRAAEGHAIHPPRPAERAPQGNGARRAPVRPNSDAPVRQNQMRHAPAEGTVAGKKMRRPDDADATRVTDISEKVEPKKSKRAKSKEDNDVGGTIVSSLLRTVIYLVTVSVIAVVLSIFVINVGNDMFAFVKSDEAIDVTIPENATRADVADILYENGVINYKAAFKFYGSIKHIEDNFVAGTYTVSPMMNYKDLYNAFKEKPVSGTKWITIPEGYTVDEIITLMLSNGIGGTKEDYVKAINEGDYSKYWFVKELDEKGYDKNRFYRLEGYLFPDTYEFYNASDAYTVINKLLARFDEIYNDKMKARAAELGLTTDQAVIIASMVEKEAGLSSDFRYVSAVFHNRLKAGGAFMYLSSDATAVYAIQHDTGERPKNVTAEMMQYDSPYNTYTHQGLPPGAISNPGINALKYALYPAENTNYYYFVSLKSGETLFASTEYEHNLNVARLRAEQENG